MQSKEKFIFEVIFDEVNFDKRKELLIFSVGKININITRQIRKNKKATEKNRLKITHQIIVFLSD